MNKKVIFLAKFFYCLNSFSAYVLNIFFSSLIIICRDHCIPGRHYYIKADIYRYIDIKYVDICKYVSIYVYMLNNICINIFIFVHDYFPLIYVHSTFLQIS